MTSSIKVVRRLTHLQSLLATPSRRRMSSNCDEVLFDIKHKGGFMLLNRPKALNALNSNMIKLISDKLSEWENKMNFVVVRGTGRAFCAGGDVVKVTQGGPCDTTDGEEFFRKEYSMNYKISELCIPYIAVIDGITMGGGVGLSVHGKYRVATENTMFAMPETQIGLFPDVGGSYVLSRLGPLGMFLALSGHRLKGIDVAIAGLATHYMDSSKVPYLLQDFENNPDPSTLENIINKHSKCLKSNDFSLDSKMDIINKVFGLSSVEQIFEGLKSDGSEWSQTTLKTLTKMSPTSLKITVRQLQEGKSKTLKECLEMEFRLASAALKAKISNDFYEGVRALLVDKDKKPKWNPSNIEDVSQDLLDSAFEKACPELEL